MSSSCRTLPANHLLLEQGDPFLVWINIDVKALECFTRMTPPKNKQTKLFAFIPIENLAKIGPPFNFQICSPSTDGLKFRQLIVEHFPSIYFISFLNSLYVFSQEQQMIC